MIEVKKNMLFLNLETYDVKTSKSKFNFSTNTYMWFSKVSYKFVFQTNFSS
jgi:hypothetical protein